MPFNIFFCACPLLWFFGPEIELGINWVKKKRIFSLFVECMTIFKYELVGFEGAAYYKCNKFVYTSTATAIIS